MIPFWLAIIGFAVGFCLGVAIMSCFAWRNYNRGHKDGYWEVITTPVRRQWQELVDGRQVVDTERYNNLAALYGHQWSSWNPSARTLLKKINGDDHETP